MKYWTLLLLAGCITAQAKLGETEAEIQARYGKPKVDNFIDGQKTRVYDFKPFTVLVMYSGGRSETESIVCPNGMHLSDNQCLSLMEVVGGSGPWNKLASDRIFETHWETESGLYAWRTHDNIKPDRLVITTKAAVIRMGQSSANKEKGIAAQFGGPVPTDPPTQPEARPVVDPEAVRARLVADREAAKEKAAQAKAAAEEKALKYNMDSAERGEVTGQYRMGMRYLKGEGVAKDMLKAREWLAKASEQGHPLAKEELQKLDQ